MRTPTTAAPDPGGTDAAGRGPAVPAATPVAETPAPGPADSPSEAEGRRTLSTAFVRLGPGEHLTIELRDGRTLALRDVVVRPRDYCGVHVRGGSAGKRYCGSFSEIAAARPVGMPVPDVPEPAVPGPARPPRE